MYSLHPLLIVVGEMSQELRRGDNNQNTPSDKMFYSFGIKTLEFCMGEDPSRGEG